MKKLNMFGFAVALALTTFISGTHASAAPAAPAPAPGADRCEGLVPELLIQAETVQNMYFDMRLHELLCHYHEKDQAVLNEIGSTIGAFKTRYLSCIKGAQDKLVENLGSEGTLENFYAMLGNQILLIGEKDPCGRALGLAKMLMKKPLACGAQLTQLYVPSFQALDKAYYAKTKSPLHRICDKTNP
jgi:hypothetical protein